MDASAAATRRLACLRHFKKSDGLGHAAHTPDRRVLSSRQIKPLGQVPAYVSDR